MHIYFGM